MNDEQFSFWSKWEGLLAAAIILGTPLFFVLMLFLVDRREPRRRRSLLLGIPVFSLVATLVLATCLVITISEPLGAAELHRDITGDLTAEHMIGLHMITAVFFSTVTNAVVFTAFILVMMMSLWPKAQRLNG